MLRRMYAVNIVLYRLQLNGLVHVAEEVGASVSLIGSSVVIEVVFLGAELIVVGAAVEMLPVADEVLLLDALVVDHQQKLQ